LLIAGFFGCFSLQAIIAICSRFIWRLFFHPLSRFPCPKLAAISNLPYVKWSLNGELHTKIQELHDRYGDVIRIRPNALTYRNAQAWADIYSHRKTGNPAFDKDPQFYIASSSGGKPNLINTNKEDHSHQKRLLTHAFSERSLRDQEELILGYIDLFIVRLDNYATQVSNDQHNALDLVH
jgi:cytochrome P450